MSENFPLFFSFLTTFSFTIYVTLVFYILFLNKQSKLNRSMAILISAFALWAFGTIFIYTSSSSIDATFWDFVSFCGAIFFPIYSLDFVLLYIGKKLSWKYKISFFLLFVPYFVYEMKIGDVYIVNKKVWFGWAPTIINAFNYNLLTLYIMVISVVAIALLIKDYVNESNSLRRRQTLTILISYSIPFVVGLITDGLFPALGIIFPPTSTITSVFLAFGIVYATSKYRFLSEKQSTQLAIEGLEKNKASLENIINSSPNMIFVTDKNGDVIKYNLNVVKKLKFPEQDFDGKKSINFSVLFSNSEKIKQTLKEIVDRDESLFFETKINPLNGDAPFYVDVKISILNDEFNEFVGFVISVADISLRKKWEKQIIEAKESAERSDELKTQLLSNVSHELITPLNSILGFSSILKEESFSEDVNEMIRMINDSALHQLKLIKNFLNVAKTETKSYEIKKDLFDFDNFLSALNKESMMKAKENNLDFICDIDERLPKYIETDSMVLKSILDNVLENAFKFTEKGYVKFKVWFRDNSLYFEIKDTGVGIKKEFQDKVFDRFFQGDFSITKKYEGTGLGLTIVKQFVDLLKGSIAFESYEGRGTTFFIRIPEITLEEQN